MTKNTMWSHGDRIRAEKSSGRFSMVVGKDDSSNKMQVNPISCVKTPAEPKEKCPVIIVLEGAKRPEVSLFLHRKNCPTCRRLAKEAAQEKAGVKQLNLFESK